MLRLRCSCVYFFNLLKTSTVWPLMCQRDIKYKQANKHKFLIMSPPIYNVLLRIVCPIFSVSLSVCPSHFRFRSLNTYSFYPIFTKLSENTCKYKMKAKFDNFKQKPTRHFWVVALEFLKSGSSPSFRSLTRTVFIQYSPNFLKMFVSTKWRPSLITSLIPPGHLGVMVL